MKNPAHKYHHSQAPTAFEMYIIDFQFYSIQAVAF